MAPIQKRRRPDDDADEVVLESASSRMRQENVQRKKVKLSEFNSRNRGGADDRNGTNDDHESSSDSDMEDTPPPGPELPQSTQYEIVRDAGFAHLENIEDDDAQASMVIDSRKKFLGENRPAESGIVEVITCVNFMCHERLEVKLGPLINFVVGKNGSGKSALVAALQICLGVKASSTNRGSNLKGMIKNGRDAAMVQIQIANRGQDAYLPDQYGQSIIVERNFTKAGASSFKLKSISKRTISTKKSDVDDLIEHFQFQVDNPMNILTQDNAKQFITKSGPSDKYRFFVKGTQLEQLDTDYKLIFETAENYQLRVYQLQDNVKALQKRADEARERARLVEKHAEMKAARKRYCHQIAWAQVEQEERSLDTMAQKIEGARQAVAAAEANAKVRAKEYDEADGLVTRAEEEVQRLEEEKQPLTEAENEAKDQWTSATNELRTLKTEQRGIREELKTTKDSVITYKDKIAEEERRLEALNGGSHSRKLAELDEAKSLVSERTSARDNASTEVGPLEARLSSADAAFQECQEPIRWKKQEITRAEQRLQELNSDRGNAMNGYHQNIGKLVTRIRNDRGFNSAPIGPIGMHCKLLKPVWSDVLEAHLGSFLNAFVVSNQPDLKRLSQLARELDAHISIIVAPNSLRPLHEPDDQFDTILRVLDIENGLVRNALVLQARVEKTILIQNPSDAEKVLYQGASPANVEQCISLNMRKRGWGIKMTAGNTDSYGPIKGVANRAPRMQTDIAIQVSKQQEILNELRRELHELEKTLRDKRAGRDKCSQALARQKKLVTDLTVDAQRAQDKVEALETEIDDDSAVDSRLDGLKSLLAESQQQFGIHEASYMSSQEAIDAQNNKCTQLKGLFEDTKDAVLRYNLKIEKAKDKSKRVAKNRQLSLQQKNESIDKVEVAKAAELIAIKNHEKQEATVEDFIQGATQITERVAVDPHETTASLDAKITKLDKQLDEYRRRQGATDEQIGLAALETHQKWQRAAEELKNQEDYCELLKTSWTDRITKWRRFQQIISAFSRMNFLYLLSERNFRGGLTFNHKQKLLEVQVEPDETRRSDKGRQTKTLSGGEKSFSSICLLLALWEAMGAPLRILDEYDVFMDDVNREVSTRMLISAARRSVGKQFVLITPHPINEMIEKENKDVNFISMPDPRNPGQQSIEESMGIA